MHIFSAFIFCRIKDFISINTNTNTNVKGSCRQWKEQKCMCLCISFNSFLTSFKWPTIDSPGLSLQLWSELWQQPVSRSETQTMTQSAAQRKRGRGVKGNRNYHMGTDQSGGHNVHLFSIKSKFCFSLRLGRWCCDPAVHGPLPHLPPYSPVQLGILLQQLNHVGRLEMGGGGYPSPPLSPSSNPCRPCTICSPQWVSYPPAGRGELPQDTAWRADEHFRLHSASLHPHARSAI